jgi:hypothetical protein
MTARIHFSVKNIYRNSKIFTVAFSTLIFGWSIFEHQKSNQKQNKNIEMEAQSVFVMLMIAR